jgi:hypothetical protein
MMSHFILTCFCFFYKLSQVLYHTFKSSSKLQTYYKLHAYKQIYPYSLN